MRYMRSLRASSIPTLRAAFRQGFDDEEVGMVALPVGALPFCVSEGPVTFLIRPHYLHRELKPTRYDNHARAGAGHT